MCAVWSGCNNCEHYYDDTMGGTVTDPVITPPSGLQIAMPSPFVSTSQAASNACWLSKNLQWIGQHICWPIYIEVHQSLQSSFRIVPRMCRHGPGPHLP